MRVQMIIKLSKDCQIVGEDGMQFVLQAREIVSDKAVGGKVSDRAGKLSGWRTKGYYGSLKQACDAAMRFSLIAAKGQPSIRALMAHMDAVAGRIERACEAVVTAKAAAELDGTVVPEDLDLDELFGKVG